MPISEREHLRKQVGGVALIATPLLGLIAAIAAPRLDSDEGTWLENIADATGRASFATIVNALSIATAVFAVLALAHLLRERQTAFGQVGGALALVGMVFTAMFLGMEAMTNEVAQSGIDPRLASELVKDTATNPVAVVAWAGSVIFAVGLVVLAIGLFRAEAASVYTTVGLGLFAIGMVVAYAAFSSPLLVASFAVLTVALVPLGWQVLRETDEAWEHTPMFRGLRPHAG